MTVFTQCMNGIGYHELLHSPQMIRVKELRLLLQCNGVWEG